MCIVDMMLIGDRFDQEVGNQANHQQEGHGIHGRIIQARCLVRLGPARS